MRSSGKSALVYDYCDLRGRVRNGSRMGGGYTCCVRYRVCSCGSGEVSHVTIAAWV